MGRGRDPRASGAWAGPGLGKDLDGVGLIIMRWADLECKEGRVGEEPWSERRNLRGVGPAMKGGANEVWARRRTDVGVVYHWQGRDGSDGTF